MADEYIKKQDALSLKKPFPNQKDMVTLYRQYFIDPEAVEQLPAADVVPVVRCYECIYQDGERPYHYCRKWRKNCPNDSDFFCKYGKRRECDGERRKADA